MREAASPRRPVLACARSDSPMAMMQEVTDSRAAPGRCGQAGDVVDVVRRTRAPRRRRRGRGPARRAARPPGSRRRCSRGTSRPTVRSTRAVRSGSSSAAIAEPGERLGERLGPVARASWPRRARRRTVRNVGQDTVQHDRAEREVPRVASSRQKNSASRSGAPSRVVTTLNVVRRSWRSRSTDLGPDDEPVVHALEVQEELGDVLEELAAEHPVRDLVEGPAGEVDDPGAAPAAEPVRHGEPAQQPPAEELGHPARRFEEVDGVAGGWRVDDDQVVAAVRVQVVEPLHRDVVVALHEPGGDVLVQAVVEDPVRGLLVGRVAQHEVVPGRLRVEHRGEQLAARLEPGGAQRLVGDAALDVAERLETERVGEPPRRVDGEHEHPAAELGHRGDAPRRRRSSSCRRHPTRRTRRSPGRRAAARGSTRSPASSAARWSATMRVTRSPWSRTNRYGR